MTAIFSDTNWADLGTITLTGGGSMLRPLTELQIPWAEGLARGGQDLGLNVAQLSYTVDLGAPRRVVCVAAAGLNAIGNATGTCELKDAVNTTLATWLSSYSVGWQLPGTQCMFFVPSDAAVLANVRYVVITLTMERPAGLVYVDQARLWVGGGAIVPRGVDQRWTLQAIDATRTDRTPRGSVFVDPQARYRRLEFSASNRTVTEQLGDGTPLLRGLFPALITNGASAEGVAILRAYPLDHRLRYMSSIYGQLNTWSPLVSGPDPVWTLGTAAMDEIVAEPL